ncbi:MAG: helix-turn-helix domain-containing protein [Solirubrobacteraceae bacterium]
MRQAMDTRGILRPAAIDDIFLFERRPPPPDLAHLVDDHWLVSLGPARPRPIPLGGAGAPGAASRLRAAPGRRLRRARQRYVRVLDGRGWAVGTKFRPAGFAAFVARPMSALTDAVVGLDELFGSDGERLAREAAACPEADAKLDAVHRFLRSRLPAAADPRSELVGAVVAEMRTAPPDTQVAELAARHTVSPRTLQRMFRRYVGVGPKWVLQRYRLHEAIEQLGGSRHADWTRFALDLGYFDHADFIRDFRAVVGRSPSQYQAEARAS